MDWAFCFFVETKQLQLQLQFINPINLKKSKLTPFWRISGAHLTGISYLLGTMHVKPSQKEKNWESLYTGYIDLCKVFATEFPLDKVDGTLLSECSLLENEQLISNLLSTSQYNKLEKKLQKTLGLPLRALLRMKPIMIVNLINERILADCNPISMDTSLWKAAEEKGKILKGIETFEEQLQLLERIPIKYQLKNLLSIGKDLGKYKRQLLHLGTLYDAGDIQKLYKISKKGLGPIRKFMLNDRNEIMATRIIELATEQPLFCAIGAGHLAGKNGVLRLLKQQGISVKPINV